MRSASVPVYRMAHVSEASAIAYASRLHVEYGLRWRWTPAKVRQQIRDPDTLVLVASLRGEMAGFAIMTFGDERAHLLLLAVLPPFRRNRIGTSMLRWLEKSCVTAGIGQVRLEVRSANQAARNFYARAGYRYVGQIAAYYDGRESASVMAHQLVPVTATDGSRRDAS